MLAVWTSLSMTTTTYSTASMYAGATTEKVCTKSMDVCVCVAIIFTSFYRSLSHSLSLYLCIECILHICHSFVFYMYMYLSLSLTCFPPPPLFSLSFSLFFSLSHSLFLSAAAYAMFEYGLRLGRESSDPKSLQKQVCFT